MSETLIADRIALQDVMLRYAAGVDERDFVQYSSCFTEDVEVLGFGPEAFNGRDAWVAHARQALDAYGATQHLLGPMLATVDGDRAHCRTDVQALHAPKTRDGRLMMLWATYETDMIRTADGWKIHRHQLVRRAMREL